MTAFDEILREHGLYPLRAQGIDSIMLQLGHKCNLRCAHCYVGGGPDQGQLMSDEMIDRVLTLLESNSGISSVWITGGSPELHPRFRYVIECGAALNKKLLVCSNVTLFSEDGCQDIPEFLAKHAVTICASLPMLFEEGAEMQRGRNVLPVVLESLRRLNSLGYGRDSSCLELDLMCNPPGASLPPPRASFEKRYRDHLGQKHGITFNALYTLNNMLLGRLRESLSAQESDSYVELLAKNFNADNVENLLCRSCVTFGPNSANCYDCDFKRVLDLPVTAGTRTVTIHEFDRDTLGNRAIETSNLCFGCTAKAGLECCADKL